MTDSSTQPFSSASSEAGLLTAVAGFDNRMLSLMQSKDFYCELCRAIAELTVCTHVLLYVAGSDGQFEYKNCTSTGGKDHSPLVVTDAAIWKRLQQGETVPITCPGGDDSIDQICQQIAADSPVLVPVVHDANLIAVVVLAMDSSTPVTAQQIMLAQQLHPGIRNLLVIRQRGDLLQKRLNDLERETEIFRQIDTELSNNIDLNYVFSMIMDWALRFTNADAAALLLYSAEENSLRLMAKYGYQPDAPNIGDLIMAGKGGIALRVARSGKPEIIADVTADPDHVPVAANILSQLTVPIYHEEKVIAVLALESHKHAGFTPDHLEFVRKLANRAGVSVDNARLFTETRREREKQSNILRNIADVVIATGFDDRVLLMNSSARLAFRLSPDAEYVGSLLSDVIAHRQFLQLVRDATESGEEISGEIELPNGRTYHTHIAGHAGIGRIIVMHDITHFKETDRLKTELVATVSHDLKQPLSVMRGYIDLLEMVNEFDSRSKGYIGNLNNAFDNMRQLIDDLLDIARIEAGLNIEFEEMNIADVLKRSVRNNQHLADKKSITIALELPDPLAPIRGDPMRLEQIFNNLISNAVKYTQPEGTVRVYTELKPDTLRIFVQDNGLGIGPEDLAQIFERFFRVRRPETDSIEGTGLGLAIVKSLIEAHHGRIDVRSKLGEGSTFRVSLPLHIPANSEETSAAAS